MNRQILTENNLEALVRECARTLTGPGAVALVPTETVYGLVTRWDDTAGRDKIYELKDRDRGKLLAMFGRDAGTLEAAGGIVSRQAARLIERFSPGPITVIVAGRNGGTIGFRIPDHPFMLRLLALLPFPLASTSANLSGEANALTTQEAAAALHGEPEIVIDAGAIAPGALGSTVVDMTGSQPKILRPGPVTEAQLYEALQ